MKKHMCAVLSILMCMSILSVGATEMDVVTGPLGWSDPPANWTRYTPDENSFTVDDKKFVLLEYRADDTDSKYLVISQDLYGRREFDADNTQKFDMDDSNNIASWLNHEFLTEGNHYVGKVYKLPQQIINHVNPNHTWRTECGWDGTNCDMASTDGKGYYTTDAGVVLMADYEYKKYAGKFGVLDNTAPDIENPTNGEGWFLRSSCQATTLCSKFGDEIGAVRAWDTQVPFGIRPMFNLNGDFFKKVKIDLSATGANVKTAIADSCTKAELKTLGYTSEELAEIFGSGIKVDRVIFTDNDGNVIEDLVPGSDINCEISVLNNDETILDMTAILCFYNKDGRLDSGSSTGRMTIAAESNTKLNAKIKLPEEIEGGTLKILFWNDLKGMTSIFEVLHADFN